MTAPLPVWTARWPGVLVLWIGWLLPQVMLLGPALVGRTVECPVDLLALPGFYLPNRPEYKSVVPRDQVLSDLVFVAPASREFMATEFRAGRLPLWRPGNFAGAPFAVWPKYSPFEWLYVLAPVPETLVWMRLLQMLTLGLGMWMFLRHALGLSYWSAALAGWCAPLTGFATLWQDYPVIAPVCWLPWSLLMAQRAVTRPWGWSTIGLVGVTATLLLSGQADVAGLVVLTTGLYVVWRLGCDAARDWQWRRTLSSVVGLTVAWLLGFCLAAPFLLPLLEYTRTGARLQARAAGFEERPPVGLMALPAVALPDVYGSTQRGSLRIAEGNALESSSSAYAGLLAVLWLAPLAWCHPQHRREAIFFSLLAIVALGWALKMPGLVHVLRLWPLNMLSYNRWTFATAYAILILSALGLEQLLSGPIPFRRWFWGPILITAGVGLCCLVFVFILPEPLYSQAEHALRIGKAGNMTIVDLQVARQRFALCCGIGALLSLAALIGWWATSVGDSRSTLCRIAIAAMLPGELFWFAAHEVRQANRALYFPRIGALEKLTGLPQGRIWGVRCLPPDLNFSHGLDDVRGYDAVDPADFVKLLAIACDKRFPSPPYAMTQFAVPIVLSIESRLKLHPVADLLNVRYLILRNPPPDGLTAVVHEDDYWVVENPRALPRAFVPRAIRVASSHEEAIETMRSGDFEPRAVAFMLDEPGTPDVMDGSAVIRYETPARIRLDVEMRTDGVVVVSDMWDADWRAELDGAPCQIHRVNVALRGVKVKAGAHTVR